MATVSALLGVPGIDGQEFVLLLVDLYFLDFHIHRSVIVQVVVHVCETCLGTLHQWTMHLRMKQLNEQNSTKIPQTHVKKVSCKSSKEIRNVNVLHGTRLADCYKTTQNK